MLGLGRRALDGRDDGGGDDRGIVGGVGSGRDDGRTGEGGKGEDRGKSGEW